MSTDPRKLDVSNLRVILKAIEAECQALQDEAERASVEIVSAQEHHRGRASAFGQVRKMLQRFETARRAVERRRR